MNYDINSFLIGYIIFAIDINSDNDSCIMLSIYFYDTINFHTHGEIDTVSMLI